ncbi:NO-inducible flavohemoprotein [Halobacillus mangrovi]|uniref:NO-inducible flavohemoprotein n=1 Tax=Halobacillus mangrovi TaxID=402384 RepID=UPI003D96D655
MTSKVGLDQRTVDIIKSTVPVLAEHGEAITKHFYQKMFKDHPELKNIFNQTHQKVGDQPKALADTVYAAAQHIDQLEKILPRVKEIAHKHRSLNVKPEHYPIVGEYLLIAIKDVLGENATDEIIEAWGEAYGIIADVFIQVEDGMYKETAMQEGGWTGFRNFSVMKKVKESDVITSFYLKPADGEAIPSYLPGQYLTIKAQIEGDNYDHLRQYSLSDAPGKDYYRISVKREDSLEEKPAGVVSTWLHQEVQEGDLLPVSAPAGDFHLDLSTKRPLVLMSGGVGFTPLLSMLNTVKENHPERDIYFIHAARNGSVHALKEEMVLGGHGKTMFIYENPNSNDLQEKAYDKGGYIDLEWLKRSVPHESEFYFCGPKGFMKAIYQSLRQWEVPESQIHFEFFGPKGSLEA